MTSGEVAAGCWIVLMVLGGVARACQANEETSRSAPSSGLATACMQYGANRRCAAPAKALGTPPIAEAAEAWCAGRSCDGVSLGPHETPPPLRFTVSQRKGERMRTITLHRTNECNSQITIEADDRNETGATRNYLVRWYERDGSGVEVEIPFQYGPLKEAGNNGLTLEVLLAICIDQLQGHQSNKYACRENALATTKIEEAFHWLEHRTRLREARGVEGTHEV